MWRRTGGVRCCHKAKVPRPVAVVFDPERHLIYIFLWLIYYGDRNQESKRVDERLIMIRYPCFEHIR